MAAIQRLSYTHSTIDYLLTRHAYRKLRDLERPRIKLLMRILAEGPLSVTEIESHMYHAGDIQISQSEASQCIATLYRYSIIMRVHPDGESRQKHYYALRHSAIRKIQTALDRFNGRLV